LQPQSLQAQAGALEVSKIFDWHGDDFSRGYHGRSLVKNFFAQHAPAE
jgi:hypothetical protein